MNDSRQELRKLIAKVGRASTPPVEDSPFGIGYDQLLGSALQAPSENSALVVAGPKFIGSIPAAVGYGTGVPGLLEIQARDTNFSQMIIETSAFDMGPWLGADYGSSKYLSEHIFEAGRSFRATGRNVYLVTSPNRKKGLYSDRIFSTATCNVAEISEVDFEEGATQSPLWHYLIDFASKF